VANDLFLVFTMPSGSIGEADYIAYRDRHDEEILQVPGFVAVRRYRLRQSRGDGFPSAFQYMTMYEVTLPEEQLREELARTSSDRTEPGWLPHEVTSQSVSARSLDGSVDATATDRAYLVFSGTPLQMTLDEYFEWNVGHQRRNMDATRLLERGFLFELMYRDGNDGSRPDFFEAYSLLGDAQKMLDEIHTKKRIDHPDQGVDHPDGFRMFSSFEANAIAERRRAD
jgi:hypothetical protein